MSNLTGMTDASLSGHGGQHAVEVARAHGVETMFTLSGAHVFPMYDGAVKADPPMRLVDVRHEQTAAFAAEATGKLTRTPGLAVLTAGPGVTNGVSAIAQAQFNGSPMVVVGGRAPANRWGTGSLQELDQPPIIAPVAKKASTLHTVDAIAGGMDEAFGLAGAAHRGPVFVDVPMDEFFNSAEVKLDLATPVERAPHDPGAVDAVAGLLGRAERPVIIFGTDTWADGAEVAALALVDALGIPAITNGMGRGIIPGGHPLLVTKARGQALGTSDLVIVVGTPLDFRLGYGVFGGKDGAPTASVVHIADSPAQVSGHAELAGSVSGDLDRDPRGARGRRRPGLPQARLVPVGDRPPGDGGRRHRARPRAARRRGRPDPPGPHLRRAGPPPGRRRGRHRRRRRLRQLRRQVRRAQAPRLLAGPRPLRLPRRRARLRRWPPGSPGRPRRWCCCSATAPPASR